MLHILLTDYFSPIHILQQKNYFTSDIRNNIESRNIDLKQLLYYIDNNVVFRRDTNEDNAKIASGKIVFQNGSYFETLR